MIAAPCEYHNAEGMADLEQVVRAINRFTLAYDRRPDPMSDEDMRYIGLPGTLAANYAIAQDGTFTVGSFGLDGFPMGFDGPWAKYSSITATYERHSR